MWWLRDKRHLHGARANSSANSSANSNSISISIAISKWLPWRFFAGVHQSLPN
jgi:hypothetical protein